MRLDSTGGGDGHASHSKKCATQHILASAEQRVLTANDATLSTVALRPHLIWGPGDNHLLPRIVDRARAGRLRFVGSVRKKIDVVYVDNAAQAHLDALDRVAPGAGCAGRAYFISNGEPVYADDMINAMLRACGLRPAACGRRRAACPTGWRSRSASCWRASTPCSASKRSPR